MIMGTTAEPYVSVAFSLTPMRHAPSDLVVPPAVFFSISGRKRYCNYVVEPDGSTGYVHGFTTHDMPPTYFDVPLFLILFAPSLWAARASSIVASSDDYYFRVGTAAHDRFLRYLCDLVPAKVDEAYSQGYCRLNVAVNVQMLIRRLVVPSAVLQPREGAGAADPVPSPTRVVVPAEMRLKELREIGEGESCAFCFEEFKGSNKKKKLEVTETPCSHLFHSDCLSPWLMTATTCPLCRSTFY